MPSPSEMAWLKRRSPVTSRFWRIRSDADGVPDGLQLQEARDLPGALIVGGAADDTLDVVRGESPELGDLAVGAGDVERVHVHVRGEHRPELLAVAGEDVDDAARHVGRGERLGQLDRPEPMRPGGNPPPRAPP